MFIDVRKVVTIQNCASQLVHIREASVESCLGVQEKLQAWLHPNNYILMELKMAVVKEWGVKVSAVLIEWG